MARINLVHVDVERLFAAQGVLAKFKRSHGWVLVQRLGLRITGCEPTHAGQRRSEALAQKMLIRNRPVTTMTAKVTPWIEKAACFEPPEPNTFDISPNAVRDLSRNAMTT